jgi:DNA-binding NtrC family response regulator
MTISEMEKVMIIETLERHGGNRTKASEALGISSRTLRNKLHEYGMMEPSESSVADDDDSSE